MTSLRVPIVLIALAVGGCDAEGSACIVGGSCEALLINRCECCEGVKANECRHDRQERCAGNDLKVPYTPEECVTLNDEWRAKQDAGENPCDTLTAAEIEDICQNFGRIGRIPDRREGPPPQTEDEQ